MKFKFTKNWRFIDFFSFHSLVFLIAALLSLGIILTTNSIILLIINVIGLIINGFWFIKEARLIYQPDRHPSGWIDISDIDPFSDTINGMFGISMEVHESLMKLVSNVIDTEDPIQKMYEISIDLNLPPKLQYYCYLKVCQFLAVAQHEQESRQKLKKSFTEPQDLRDVPKSSEIEEKARRILDKLESLKNKNNNNDESKYGFL